MHETKDGCIVTKGIILVDDAGRHRARFALGPDGEPALQLGDKDGTLRFSLGYMPDGEHGVILRDANGTPSAALTVSPNGRGHLMLLDAGGAPRAGLGLCEDGTPIFHLMDSGGVRRMALSIEGTEELPQIVVSDAVGRPRLAITDNRDGQTDFFWLDADGKPLCEVPPAKMLADAEKRKKQSEKPNDKKGGA